MEKVTWLKQTAGQKSKEKLKNDEIEKVIEGTRLIVVRFSRTDRKTDRETEP